MERKRTRKTPHPGVSMARMSLLNCFLLGTLMIWPVLATPSTWAFGAVAAVLLLVVFLQDYRLRRNTRDADITERPAFLSYVPVACVVVAFLGYGVTLTLVHSHYFDRRTSEYGQTARRFEQQISAQAEGLRDETRKATARLEKARWLTREENRLSRVNTRDTREAAELAKLNQFLATVAKRHSASSLSRRAVREQARTELGSLVQNARFARHGAAGVLGESLLLALSTPGSKPVPGVPKIPTPPKASELPPWFDHLSGFFTVSTQLLAGLAIVLAFGRWRSGVSEAVWRTAMPVAVVGVVFGLAGNLPSLSAALQAIFLGPVLAGLAGALGGLIVVTMEPRTSPASS